ncbi:MAG: aminotransferase class III-fold pyridoxal phosphate-dependent enzyme, partial [Deltaproteobacteria bacterium]|nr:aminotransferase class III-fold pyridoxal phosphate-dependent enzyme [Deltaproteobacteria bacterium]
MAKAQPFEQTLDAILTAAGDTLGLRPHQLGPDRNVTEHGVDGGKLSSFILEIREKLGVSVPADFFLNSDKTFGDLAVLVRELPAAADPEAAGPAPASPEPRDGAGVPGAAGGSGGEAAPLTLLREQMVTMRELFRDQWIRAGGAPGDFPYAEPPKAARAAPGPESRGPEAEPDETPELLSPSLNARQAAFADELLKRHKDRTRASRKALENSLLAYPPERFRCLPFMKDATFPVVVKHYAGAHILDLDDNDYLDFSLEMGYWGHNPPYAVEAMDSRLERGFGDGSFSDAATAAAERAKILSGNNKIAFFATEEAAARAAILLARAATGKNLTVVFSPDSPGVPEHLALSRGRKGKNPRTRFGGDARAFAALDYGQEKSLAALMEMANDLAAVYVEPVSRGDLRFRSPSYFSRVRRITRDRGI